MPLDSIPPIPALRTPGQPGDFAFLTGEWRIANRSIVDGAWLEYPGEATVSSILAGAGSVEDLRMPVRNFAGLGLRLLDMQTRAWHDHWVNAKSGVLTLPGGQGSFEDGVGIFTSDYQDGDRTLMVIGIWDAITESSCRWRQAISSYAGAHWEPNWIMHWTRA